MIVTSIGTRRVEENKKENAKRMASPAVAAVQITTTTTTSKTRSKRRSELQESIDVLKAVGGKRATGQRYSKRERLHLLISSIPWLVVQLIAAIVDVACLSITGDDKPLTLLFSSGFVTLIFCCDLVLRVFTYRRVLCATCFSTMGCLTDVVIVALSLLFWCLEAAALLVGSASPLIGFFRSLVVIPRGLRALRAMLQVRALCIKVDNMMRHITGENKTRYLDLVNGFDLDLAYVYPPGDETDQRLIAMSVPTTGLRSWFRNPLSEVVRFFETRHAAGGGYLIVNACPELPYPHEPFASGSVSCFNVQDHTPPTMEQFADFLNLCAARPAGSTIAVHCRGGKGRTGSLVSAWLLYSRSRDREGVPLPPEDVLNLFALRRTEGRSRKRKLQGVETPSQKRYVGQLFQMLEEQGGFCSLPSAADPTRTTWAGEARTWLELGAVRVRAPSRPSIVVQHVELNRWFAPANQSKVKTRRIVCAVHVEKSDLPQPGAYYVTSWSRPVELWPEHPDETQASGAAVETTRIPSELLFEFAAEDLPVVSGDVRVSFFDLDQLLAARAKRQVHGKGARLPFDLAASGPWDDGGEHTAAGAPGDATPNAAEKMVIAGKEPGCLFFWLFHTAFVESHFNHRGTRSSQDVEKEMRVDVAMMDKAFKNKKGLFDAQHGKALLSWAPAASDAVKL